MAAINASLATLYPILLTALMHEKYTIFSGENGLPFLITIDYSPLTPQEQATLAINKEHINFTLFTRNNRPFREDLLLYDTNSVTRSDWNPKRPTIFVTHGWNNDGTSLSCSLIRDAFLKVVDCNVIVIDWGRIAKNMIYSIAARSVPAVAERVATFVNFLRAKANLNTASLKMVGHSLGAHVVSLAAGIVSESSLVAEVIALDPARPMFQSRGPTHRVDHSHARNVQVIHTCSGFLGMNIAVGTSDFFANGGSYQPGCKNDLLGFCSHVRSYQYYSESIINPRGFPGIPEKPGIKAYMGGPVNDARAIGIYYFKTANKPPYALGG